MLNNLKWNKDGLIPVITVENNTGEVLMFAFMDKEALEKTLETGEAHYYSRSRDELWHKGKTSGNIQIVKKIKVDCDQDSVLLRVDQTGEGACHQGDKSCFHFDLNEIIEGGGEVLEDENGREQTPNSLGEVLFELAKIVKKRKEERPEGAYTTYLFEQGIDKILKKVGEESTEVVIAAKNPDDAELIYEVSDLLYHLIVLFEERNIPLREIYLELLKRFKS